MSPIERQEYWFEKAHDVIDSGYQSAIDKYRQQKKNFLDLLNISGKDAIDEFLAEINAAVQRETEDTLQETFDAGFNEIASYMENNIAKFIDTGDADWNVLVEKFKNSKTISKGKNKGKQKTPKEHYRGLINDIEKFLTKGFTKDMLIEQLVKTNSFWGKNQNIKDQAYGYARKLIFKALTEKNNKLNTTDGIGDYQTSFIQTLKGYYQEETLVPALSQVLAKYGITADRTAEQTDSKGKEIKYDVILRRIISSDGIAITKDQLSALIQRLDTFNKATGSSSVEYEELDAKGAIQSKSWGLPLSWLDEKKRENAIQLSNRNFFKIGYNSALRPTGVDKHYWHAGVYNVMSSLEEALGISNMMFVTGDEVYFTCDLLAEFREHQYVFAFGWLATGGRRGKGEIATYIQAMSHDDSGT